jgi:alkanesulfonate monooxygenase SsuD/methylene tetrahydromethanopterin reductase-like flavin-dependent oxidoreductase (luciferase family)
MVDLISGGRLEFGIGSGAYQREFDRMKPGLKQSDAWRYMQEMLPVVRDLWQGDVAHDGEFWQFPTSTSVPKPVQPEVPVWVSARSPITYDYAMRNRCHVNCWPLTRSFDEAELYKQQLDEAIIKADNGWSPRFALMRHACLYDNAADRQEALDAIRRLLSQFENLFRNSGNVVNGFPASIPLDELDGREQYDPAMLEENLLFGTSETVIQKLKRYQALGVSDFIYYASMGLSHAAQKRSLRMFCAEVMPEFAEQT